jgi:hypothetical protein
MREFALVGQCRGDLALFVRQLERIGVVVSFQRNNKLSVVAKSAPAIVILGDLICPLNAWCSYPSQGNQDAQILELAVKVACALGAGLVCGLHEQMLILKHATERCMQGANHRRLLALVANADFRAAFARARKNNAYGVVAAGMNPAAIVSDNRTRAPPPELAPYWDRMSVFDRGTRFICARKGAGGYFDLPVIGLGSAALAVHPLALRDHLLAEYGRLRSSVPSWKATVEAIGEQYAAFDRARRRCLLVLPFGKPVPDTGSGFLAGSVADLHGPLMRVFDDIIERYHLRGVTSAELYAVTIRALGLVH